MCLRIPSPRPLENLSPAEAGILVHAERLLYR
jgi:hypothetical protein